MASSSTSVGALNPPDNIMEPKHKVFLSHSGAQKDFVEQLCVDLERCDRYPFFDKRRGSLPIGKEFPKLIFEVIRQCEVGVVVLSEEFFIRSKWPMLELTAMVKNSKLVIIPVYFGIKLDQVRDAEHQARWRTIWRGWAEKDEHRIRIEEWEEALKALGPLNSLLYDGGGEVSFRKEIVEAICKFVQPLSRWKVSHIKGRHRMTEVICGWINQASKSKRYKICMIGIYGVGGIGKTTICQALCNEYFMRMQGRVFHAELGTQTGIELLHGALKSLSDKGEMYAQGLNESECKGLLKEEIVRQPMFLAVDNILGDIKSIEGVNVFLKGGFAKGSVVVLTARSLDVLQNAHLGLDGSNCFEMPELNKDEAKSLFLEHAACDKEDMKVEIKLMDRSLKRCYFQKGDGESYHYHPLALKVLGLQLSYINYDPARWGELLKELDTFNFRREGKHPIFSILQRSYDILTKEDQMLFMDVAVFLPERIEPMWWNRDPGRSSVMSSKWLSMVHGTNTNDILEGLKRLKRNSLVQDLGDDLASIGMHDLWREFALRKSQEGEFEGRMSRNIESDVHAHEEEDLARRFWQNFTWMGFLSKGVASIIRMDYSHFSNIKVLKLGTKMPLEGRFMLNFTRLENLKSLEVLLPGGNEYSMEVVGLQFLKKLLYLQLQGVELPTSAANDIGYLLKLRCLVLIGPVVAKLPNMRRLKCLDGVHVIKSKIRKTSSYTSTLVKLQTLNISDCLELRRLDSSIGELLKLQYLCLARCRSLRILPNLKKLTCLEILDISGCSLIESVPGLDDLVALKEFVAYDCNEIAKLPNLQKLTCLELLYISGCSKIESVPGLDDLVALKEFRASCCTEIAKLPNLQRLTCLKLLYISGCSKIESVLGLDDLVALKEFRAFNCTKITKLPNLQKLTCLELLYISQCSKIESVPGLDDLVALKELRAMNCTKITKLPNLQKFTCLEHLDIAECSKIELVPGLDDLVALKVFRASNCTEIAKLPNLQRLTCLEILDISGCSKIELVSGLDDLVALKGFWASKCNEIAKLPNLQKLTCLEHLDIAECSKIELVPGLDDLVALKEFRASDCTEIAKLPNLQRLTCLELLYISGCSKIESVPGLVDLVALKELRASNCTEIAKLPNLQKLTCLELLYISGCSKTESVPGLDDLVALKEFTPSCCTEIAKLPNLQRLTCLKLLNISGCSKIESVLGLDELVALKGFRASNCTEIAKLPNLRRLTCLEILDISGCSKIESVPGLDDLVALKRFRASNCTKITKLPNLQKLTCLELLYISQCSKIESVPGLDDLVALKELRASNCTEIAKLPNLRRLTCLELLYISGCSKIEVVPGLDDLVALKGFRASNCTEIAKLPNLRRLTCLEILDISGCSKIESAPGLDDLVALKRFRASNCAEIAKLPNLRRLTCLEDLDISGCSKIELVSGLDDLVALKEFRASNCKLIAKLPTLRRLTCLEILDISGCSKIESVPGLDDLVALKEFTPSNCI